MGEARRRLQRDQPDWPRSDTYIGKIELHILKPVAAINGARMRALTGNERISETAEVILSTFHAMVGERTFQVGFCLGSGEQFSAVGIAVIDRLMMEAPGAPLHVVPVIHEEIAWDIVLRHLRSFTGRVLLFAFPNSDVYDAGTAQVHYSQEIRCFDEKGAQLARFTESQLHQIRAKKAEILNRLPPSILYDATGIAREDSPWIFGLLTPAGKLIHTAVWDGRRDYAHEIPADIIRWVGGETIAIVQVETPVGIDRRSSLDLTHRLAKDFDSVIHWARDTRDLSIHPEVFHSPRSGFGQSSRSPGGLGTIRHNVSRERQMIYAEMAYPLISHHRGNTVFPISPLSTAWAAWRPSRIAQTTSDWPRRMSPQAKTLSAEAR